MADSGDDLVITNAGAGQVIEIPEEVLLRNDSGLFVAGIESVTGADLANGDVSYTTPSDFPASDGAFTYQASDGTGLGDPTTVTVSGVTGQTITGTSNGEILLAAPAVPAPSTVGGLTAPSGFTMSLTPFGERPTGGTIYVAQTFTAPTTAAAAQNLRFELGNYAGLSDIEFRVLIVTNDGTGVDLWGRPNFSPGQVLFTSATLTMPAGASTTEFNVALSGLSLAPGQTYAFVLDAIGVTASEGLGTAAPLLNTAGYAGGDSYTLNNPTGSQSTDFLANFSPVQDTDLNFEIAFDTPPAGVTLDGQDGDDSLIGAAGNDTLLGGGGDDWLFGKAGDDVLQGGANNDRIDAGAGNDRIVYRIFDGVDTIDGGREWSGGGDVLEVRNTTGLSIDWRIGATSGGAEIEPSADAGASNAVDGLLQMRFANPADPYVDAARFDEIEKIELHLGAGDTVTVGNLAGTAFETGMVATPITITGATGNETVDIAGADAAHMVLFDGGSGDDTARLAGHWVDYRVTTEVRDGASWIRFDSKLVTDKATSHHFVLQTAGVEHFYFSGDDATIDSGVVLPIAPVAVNDTGGTVTAAGTEGPGTPTTPDANVLTNDTDANMLDRLYVGSVAVGANKPAGTTVVAATGFTAVTGTYGTLFIAQDGTWHYTINSNDGDTQALTPGQHGADAFTYVAVDDAGLFSKANITVDVVGANDAPTSSDGNVYSWGKSDGPFEIFDTDFQAVFGDADGDGLAAIRITALPAYGTLIFNGLPIAAGDLPLVIPADQIVSPTDDPGEGLWFIPANRSSDYAAVFQFQVQDTRGAWSVASASYTIDVSATNEAPSGTDGLITIDEDTRYTFSVADFGFSDPDGNALAAIEIATIPAQGTLYYDADGEDPANAVSVTPGQSISADAIAAGKLFFRPAADASGLSYANFKFQVQDDGGTQNGGHDLDATANVIKFRVTATPDAPVAVDDNPNTGANPVVANPASPIVSYQGPASVLANDSDVDAGETVLLRVAKVGASEAFQVAVAQTGFTTVVGTYGSLLIKWSGNYEYRLDSSLASTMGLAAGEQATEHFVYTVANNGGGPGNEDIATISIVVQGANDAPRDISLSSNRVDESSAIGTVVGTLSAFDPDGNPITWTLNDSAGGRFAVDPNTGVVTVADGALLDFESRQSYIISATASDGALGGSTPLTISLNDVNDAPTVQFVQNTQAFSITENVPTADQERGLLNIFDDALGTNIVSLSGQYAGLFYFTTSGGTYYLHLKSGFVPDFEADGTIEVTVNIDDPAIGDGPEVSFLHTVNVINVDEPAVTSSITIAMDENAIRVLTAADFPYRDPEGVRAMTAVEILNGPSNGKLFYDPTGGDRSDAIQVTGSRTVSKAALDAGQLWFVAAADANGAAYANFNFQVADAQGLSNVAQMTFDVRAVNDAPLWIPPSRDGDSYFEGGTAVVLSGMIQVVDRDLDALNGGLGDYSGATVTLRREVAADARDIFGFDTAGANFTVSGNQLLDLAGNSFASFSRSGGVLTISFQNGGAIPTSALVDKVVQHITYASSDDAPRADFANFLWSMNDGGLGDSAALTATTTTRIAIQPTNDAPVNDVPDAQSVDENTALVFAAARGNAITVHDVDAGLRDVSVTLSVLHGTLTLGATAALRQVGGDGTGTITLLGDLTAINSALEGLIYRGNLNYSGSDTLTVETNDLGNTGSFSPRSDVDMVAITVNNLIVAPATDAAILSGQENTPIAVTLSGTDSDGTVASFLIVSPPQNGALFLDAAGTTPVNPNDIVATGGVAIIYFVPALDFSGSTSFQYFAVDNDGAVDASPALVSIQIAAVNNAPVVSGPVTLAMPEDGTRLITQAELLGAASDSDGPLLRATNLAITSGSGALVDNLDGTWSYTAAPDDDTAVTFSYLVDDGIAPPVAAAATLDITPVNDAPVNTVPGPRQVGANVIAAIAGLAIHDVDAGSGILTTTLSVAHGTLTVAAVDGAVVSGSGTGRVTIDGTLAQIDATLGADNVVYAGQQDFSGTDTLTMTTTDNGNTGGGPLTDTDQVAITVSAAEKPVEPTDPPATHNSNFLWQNQDGTAALWTMNGLTVTAGANIGINPGPSWHALGTGDFNGDGKADILWQNADGAPAVWLMDGFNLIGGANVGFNPGAAWHVIAAADFNGDGKSDILWQNLDGTPAVWLMDGFNLLGGADVGFNPGAAWHAIGAGDFDGDGKADILWQHNNGQAAVWLMNGLSLTAGTNVGSNPGAAWQVQAAGDFNGDGKADILWQNTDGSPAVWLMNGFDVVSGANVGFNPGPNWKIHGSGDFNGDRKADIAWQNADGTPAVWLMDGLNVVAGSDVGFNPGPGWHAIPQHHELFG